MAVLMTGLTVLVPTSRYASSGSAGVHLIAPVAPSRLRHTSALTTGLMSPVTTVAPTGDAFGPRPRGTPG